MKYRKCRAGFTLIELLVVIAIIAILAAILFPVFAKARERAKLSACLSNQKQLYTAVVTYSDDCDGKMPFGISFYDGAGRPGIEQYVGDYRQRKYSLLYTYLVPYVKNDGIFQCPSDNSETLNTLSHKRDQVTYRFNPYGSGGWAQDGTHIRNPNGPFAPLTIAQCRNPSSFAMFRERSSMYHSRLTAQEVTDANATNTYYSKVRTPVLRIDGSVKMLPGQLPDGYPPGTALLGSFQWTGSEPPQ